MNREWKRKRSPKTTATRGSWRRPNEGMRPRRRWAAPRSSLVVRRTLCSGALVPRESLLRYLDLTQPWH